MTWSRHRGKYTTSVLSVIKVRYRIAGRSHDEYEYDHISGETRDIIIRAWSWKYDTAHRWSFSMSLRIQIRSQIWKELTDIASFRWSVRIKGKLSLTSYWRHQKLSSNIFWYIDYVSSTMQISVLTCFAIDWWHWLDFWTGSFLSFWRTSMIRIRFDFIFVSFSDISPYGNIHMLFFSRTTFDVVILLNIHEFLSDIWQAMITKSFVTNTCVIRSGTHPLCW